MIALPRTLAAVVLLEAALVAGAAAQSTQGTPNALQGFSKNQNQPIKIESLSLELRDKDKVATFIDNVKLVQGDTTLECKRLVVHYDEEAAPGSGNAKTAKGVSPPPGQQQIRRLEAKGGVVVKQKDQTATGDSGVYDMKTNTMTLMGNVVVMQGQNVVRGDRLFVDMTTGVSRVESGSAGQGRVQGLFLPNSRDAKQSEGGKPSDGAGAAQNNSTAGSRAASGTDKESTDKEKPKQGASRPLRLN